MVNAICAIVLYIGFVRSLGLGGGRQGHINQALSTDEVYFNLPDYNHVALNLVRDSQIFEIFRIRTAQIIFLHSTATASLKQAYRSITRRKHFVGLRPQRLPKRLCACACGLPYHWLTGASPPPASRP